jgi:hypothetical protein
MAPSPSGYGLMMAEISMDRPKRRLAGLTQSPPLDHGAAMNGFLSICGLCREIMS